MGAKMSASMPQDLDFGVNYRIRITALDPVTGAHVDGVVVSDTSIFVATTALASADQLTAGQPLWLPIPLADQSGTGSDGGQEGEQEGDGGDGTTTPIGPTGTFSTGTDFPGSAPPPAPTPKPPVTPTQPSFPVDTNPPVTTPPPPPKPTPPTAPAPPPKPSPPSPGEAAYQWSLGVTKSDMQNQARDPHPKTFYTTAAEVLLWPGQKVFFREGQGYLAATPDPFSNGYAVYYPNVYFA